jgi:hypothetical protein
MIDGDPLRNATLVFVDALIASTAFSAATNAGPYRDMLQRWSAVHTANGDTTRAEDNAVWEAFKFWCCCNEHYL